ncbi:unnamed protein product [Rhizoctonia solani]|uniref:Uncharacterized protein n=1 Tax=Rhizoctonia solani TaxID=456999 RepID=A0A8H3GLX8_9AGAM|nr:unnamed protein product [Rhizoctonia solani]
MSGPEPYTTDPSFIPDLETVSCLRSNRRNIYLPTPGQHPGQIAPPAAYFDLLAPWQATSRFAGGVVSSLPASTGRQKSPEGLDGSDYAIYQPESSALPAGYSGLVGYKPDGPVKSLKRPGAARSKRSAAKPGNATQDLKCFRDLSESQPNPELNKSIDNLMKYLGFFLVIKSDDEYFDWQWFKESLDNRPDADLTICSYAPTKHVQMQDAGILSMTEKLVNHLSGSVRATLTQQDKRSLSSQLKATFSIKPKLACDWIGIYEKKHAYNSSFSYRLLFNFPNKGRPAYFHSLVITIEVTAEVTEESYLWGTCTERKRDFSCKVTCMTLSVAGSFMAGAKPKRK